MQAPVVVNSRAWRSVGFALLAAYVLLCLLYVAQYALRNFALGPDARPDPYTTLDWLINYSTGFVRRGASGELVRLLAHWTSLSQVTIATLLPLAAYTLFCVNILRMAARRPDLQTALLLLSPLALAFPVVTPAAMLRKEVLHFALLSWLAWRYVNRAELKWPALLTLALGLPALALCHELIVPLAPIYAWLLLALHREGQISARSLKMVAAWLAVSLPIVVVAVVTHGRIGMAEVDAMCRSFDMPPSFHALCVGDSTVNWLTRPASDSVPMVGSHIRQRHYLEIYGFALSFGLLAIAMATFNLKSRPGLAGPAGMGLAALAASILFLPIFVVALDWGRWLHILFMTVAVGVLALRAAEPPTTAAGPPAAGTPGLHRAMALMLVCSGFIGIPHAAGLDRLGFGLFGVVLGKLGY